MLYGFGEKIFREQNFLQEINIFKGNLQKGSVKTKIFRLRRAKKVIRKDLIVFRMYSRKNAARGGEKFSEVKIHMKVVIEINT